MVDNGKIMRLSVDFVVEDRSLDAGSSSGGFDFLVNVNRSHRISELVSNMILIKKKKCAVDRRTRYFLRDTPELSPSE